MFSQLHSRKKTALHDTTTEAIDPEAGGASNPTTSNNNNNNLPSSPLSEAKRKHHRSKRTYIPREIQWAFSSVSIFLACGLFLGYFLIHHKHRKVIYHVLRDPVGHGRGVLQGRVGFRHHFFSGPPRYVTVVLPSVVKPESRRRRLNSIQDTWGPSARAIYVVHNVTEFPQAAHAVIAENKKPEDPYAFPQLLMLPQEISFSDGLPQLYYTIRNVFEKVNPDFAFFVNDHTFVLSTHVCNYLEDKHPTEDLYAGHALANDEIMFNSGAAGYVLSRETMRRLVEKWDAKYPTCWIPSDNDSSTKKADKWLQGNPGLVNAKCLASMNVLPIDTRAKQKWHRFHAFPLTRVVTGKLDDWYAKKHQKVEEKNVFHSSYGTLLSGPDCCSADTISFHYVEWKESLALFAVREDLLKNPHLSDHELKSIILAEWPKSQKDIGGYSRGLPTENDKKGWQDLMTTIRKISTRETQRDC